MNITNTERIFENKRLKRTLDQISSDLNEQIKYYKKFKEEIFSVQNEMFKEITSTPSELWELSDAVEAWYYQNEIEKDARKIKSSEVICNKLRKMLNSPYFGRIDFKEKNEDKHEIFYIGIGNIVESSTSDFLVLDWRAPIASLFYDYEIGSSEYKSPDSIIKGNLILKRQYKIEKGILQYILNSSLKIDDDILMEILCSNTNDKMKSIVTSIQREQNKIIRDDKHDLMIVQGPAGSGKTSISLHRIAYLLYRYKETIKSKNILVFSPNEVFNDYISNVLPELGEENMQQTTFIEYAKKLLNTSLKLEEMNEQMDLLLSNKDSEKYLSRIRNIKYKTSLEFIDVLNNYITFLVNESIIFNDIYYNDNLIISKEDLQNMLIEKLSFQPFFTRLKMIRSRVLYLLKPYEKKRSKEVYEEFKTEEPYDIEESLREKTHNKVKAEFGPIKDKIKFITTKKLLDVYFDLFKNKDLFNKINNNLLPDYFTEIKNETLECLKTNTIKYEDIAPIIYLKIVLEGNPISSSIKHIVIDEAQDYTPLQYSILKLLFDKSKFTLLGDLNQSINPLINIGNFKKISKIFNVSNSAILELNKSYRSTKEITSFTRALLDNNLRWEYIEREGIKPVINKISIQQKLNRVLCDIDKLKNEGYKSIAIICKTEHEAKSVFQDLKNHINISILTNDDFKYPKGIVVLPSYLSKGLEFDAVLVYSCNDTDYYLEDERKLLYTVCTRALHRLYLYYNEELSPFLKSIDNNLYTLIIKE